MITFTVLCTLVGILFSIAIVAILVTAVVGGGLAVILLDICIGVLPFIGIYLLFKWLIKPKEKEVKNEEKGREGSGT